MTTTRVTAIDRGSETGEGCFGPEKGLKRSFTYCSSAHGVSRRRKAWILDSRRCGWNYSGSFTGCAVSRGKASEHLHYEGQRQKDATCAIRETTRAAGKGSSIEEYHKSTVLLILPFIFVAVFWFFGGPEMRLYKLLQRPCRRQVPAAVGATKKRSNKKVR